MQLQRIEAYNGFQATPKGGNHPAPAGKSVSTFAKSPLPTQNRQLSEKSIWLTVEEGGNLCGVSKQSIRKACRDGRLVSRSVEGNGGEQYEINLASLPDEAKLRYWLERLGSPLAHDEPDEIALPAKAQQTALLRADLLRIYLRETEGRGSDNLTARKELFAARYANGEWPDLLTGLGKVSWKTLERWKKTWRDANGDPLALAPQYKREKGLKARKVTATQAVSLLRYLLMSNRLKTSEVIRQARKEWMENGVSGDVDDMTLRRWIEDWIQENRDTYEYMVNGRKAWNDRVAPFIIRRKEDVEFGDILVADGHVLNFEILNPETGRPKRQTLLMVYDFRTNIPLGWEIMPTENVRCVSSAFRRAILRMGFRPKTFYLDNGKAFRAKFFSGVQDFEQTGLTGLFERLGSSVIYAWPYHGQSKTVERFFGTFAELERLQPSYTGTSIEARPAHLKRGERLARTLRSTLADSTAPTIIEAHQIIADWCAEYIERPQKQALRGLSPRQVAEQSLDRLTRSEGFEERRISEPELRLLMMETSVRTLYRNGIKFNGEFYWHDTFAMMAKGAGTVSLRVLYDWQDMSSLIVLKDDGSMLGVATRVTGIHPAARQLGTGADVMELESAINHRRAVEAGVKMTVQNLASALYPKSEDELPTLPSPSSTDTPESTRMIDWKVLTPSEEKPQQSRKKLALFECERRPEE